MNTLRKSTPYMMILTIFTIILGQGTAFADFENVKRVTNYPDLSQGMAKTNRVIGLLVHRGKCESEDCQKKEAVLKEVLTKKSDHALYWVIDCDDMDKWEAENQKEGENTQSLKDCTDEFKDQLPIITFLQPPMQKYDNTRKQIIGHIRMGYEGEYTNEALKSRIDHLVVSFRAVIENKDHHEQLKGLDKAIPVLYYFNDQEDTPLALSLLSQDYAAKVFIVEIAPGYDWDHPLKDQATQRPYILIDKKTSPDKQHELITDFQLTYDILKSSTSSLLESEQYYQIVYTVKSIYKNHDEIEKMRTDQAKNVLNDIDDDSFEKVLKNPDAIQVIYLYTNKDEIKSEVFQQMANLKYPLLPYIMDIKFITKVFENDLEEAQKLIDQGNNLYLLMPFGNPGYKKSRSLLFDDLTTQKIVNGIVKHWIGEENLITIKEATKSGSQVVKTLKEGKVQIILFAKQNQLSFEYLLTASHPVFQEKVNFGLAVDPTPELMAQFSVRGNTKLPIILSLSYAQENFNAGASYMIKQFRDKDDSGYTNFVDMAKFVKQEIDESRWFESKYSRVLEPLFLQNLDDIEWDALPKTGKHAGNSKSRRNPDEIYFLRMSTDEYDYKKNFKSFKDAFYRFDIEVKFIDRDCFPKLAKKLKVDPEENHILFYKKGADYVLLSEFGEIYDFRLKKHIDRFDADLGRKIKLETFNEILSGFTCFKAKEEKAEEDRKIQEQREAMVKEMEEKKKAEADAQKSADTPQEVEEEPAQQVQTETEETPEVVEEEHKDL